ncbi:MAG: alpha/beta fold hydrolase [Acidimicrobiia bacterium]
MPQRKWLHRSLPLRPVRRVEFLDLSAGTVRVSVEGVGSPLLLLTGLGGNLDLWGPLVPHLRGFELLAFDPPGTGASGPVRRALGMPGMADLAAEVLDTLGRERVDVLGYSWGGALAQELAHRHPERVGRLVLCATTCGLGGMPGNPRALAELATPWRYAAATFRAGHCPRLVGYAAQLCAIAQWTSLPWLHQLEQPTLIVAAEHDAVAPIGNSRLLAGRIPDSRVHVVTGAGHLLLIDEPESVAPVVRSFLLQATSAGAGRGARGVWSFLARSRTG